MFAELRSTAGVARWVLLAVFLFGVSGCGLVFGAPSRSECESYDSNLDVAFAESDLSVSQEMFAVVPKWAGVDRDEPLATHTGLACERLFLNLAVSTVKGAPSIVTVARYDSVDFAASEFADITSHQPDPPRLWDDFHSISAGRWAEFQDSIGGNESAWGAYYLYDCTIVSVRWEAAGLPDGSSSSDRYETVMALMDKFDGVCSST